jgi:preprotein translocase subunit YajC
MQTYFLSLLVMGVILYFLIVRPQQQKQKQHVEMVSNLEVGNRIITIGGISGVVKEIISENRIKVEIADGVIIELLKNAVAFKDEGYEEDHFDLDEETIEALETKEATEKKEEIEEK